MSDDPVIQAIVRQAEAGSEVEALARALAEDIGPRLTGSGALVNAEEWAVETLAGWGLEARREPWGEIPVGFERGPAYGAVVRPRQAEGGELAFVTDAWSAGTKGRVRGPGVLMPTNDAELRARQPYLRGAWVFVPFGGAGGDTGANAGADAGSRSRIVRALERAGIAGWVEAAGGPEDTLLHTAGEHRIEWKALPKRVEIHLRGDQHHALSEQLRRGDLVELEFDIDNHFIRGPLEQHNVIATFEGEALPGERVIIGGHLDSWDGASGAIDNATGVATAMEAARLLALACAEVGVRPRRTIEVMLWTGEEQGLLGSRAWVEAHPEALDSISAVFVQDGGTNYLSGLPVTVEMLEGMEAVFAPVQALERRRAMLEGAEAEAMPFRLRVVESLIVEPSDSASFVHADVPGFYWDQAGRSDYARYHHTQRDDFEAIDDRYQRRSALVVAIAAWGLAQAEELVTRANAGPLEPRRLGVRFTSQRGLEILEVIAGSPAAEADLEVGDRVEALDGEAVSSVDSLVERLQEGDARKVLGVVRGGAPLEVSLDWSETPAERERARRRQERRDHFGEP